MYSFDFSVGSWVLTCTESPFYSQSFRNKFVYEFIFERCPLVGHDFSWNTEFAEHFFVECPGLCHCFDIFHWDRHDEVGTSVDERQDVIVPVLCFREGTYVVDVYRVPWFRHEREFGENAWLQWFRGFGYLAGVAACEE